MATALAATVSHYVPTFNKVELMNTIVHQKDAPASPNGAGGDDNSNVLVLTQSSDVPFDTISNASSSSARSHKSDKMQKKLDFEAGNTTKTHRVLRTLSKTLRPSKAQPTPSASEIKKSRTLNRTVSQHEINKDIQNKKTTELKKSSNLNGSNGIAQRKGSNATLNAVPQRKASNASLSGVPQRKGSNANLKSSLKSSLNKSLTPSDLEPEVKKRSTELKRSNNANLKRSNNSELRRSGNGSGMPSRKAPVPSQLRTVTTTKADPLNAILNDFQMQKQRALELSQIESDIYSQEVAKYEEMLSKKKQESEAAITLANNIKERETQLERLFADLHQKEKEFKVTQDDLSAFNKEFEEEVKKQEADLMETSGEKSSALRMKEAANRKTMKSAWKNADASDPQSQARKRMLEAQEELNTLQVSIAEAKRELGRMKGQASKGKSADHRMRDERLMREEKKKTGAVTQHVAIKRSSAPREPEKRAHQSRLEEEKAKRAAKRRANADVADLIAQQAGVSRSRFGSPYRAGMTAGPSSSKAPSSR